MGHGGEWILNVHTRADFYDLLTAEYVAVTNRRWPYTGRSELEDTNFKEAGSW